jgi:hypothetical protein
MSSKDGKHASYNVQSVIDDKNGLIVHAEAINDVNDRNQFARQIEQSHDVLEKPCQTACADAGYAHTNELEKIDAQEIMVIVPSQRQALHEGQKPFGKQDFRYNKEQDCYYCPKGHRLRLAGTEKKNGKKRYQIVEKEICLTCQHYGICTTGKNGRRIVRLHNEEMKEKLEEQYKQRASQEIYSRRKARVEHPFGHMKRNLKTQAFILRGRDGVQAETSLLATCFNIARLITILGVSGIIRKLAIITAPATG